jgi:hypothetical protein
MSLISEDEKARLISLGSVGILREISDGKHCQPTSLYRDEIDDLLSYVKSKEEMELVKVPYPAPQPPAAKTNYIHDIGVGTLIVILGACAIWAVAYYFDIHL